MITQYLANKSRDITSRVILWITGLWLLTYIGWTVLLGTNESSMHPPLATVSLAIIQFLAAYFSNRISHDASLDERFRKAWGWISIALIASGLAEALWFVYATFAISPLPWLTDILYFLYYALILVALFHLPFASAKPTERIIFWLDLIIVMLATLLVLFSINYDRFMEMYQQDPQVAIFLIFPLGDAILFAGMAALLQRDIERLRQRAFVFLTLAFGLHGLAEGLTFIARLNWDESAHPYIYILWLLGAFCFLLAAVTQSRQSTRDADLYPSHTRYWLRFILPYLAVIVGWSTLIYTTFISQKPDIRLYGTLIGSLLLGILVLLRQYNLLVENIHLYADMQRLAITDTLTGLYNRHYFNQVLNRELLRAERYRSPLILLLADVDDFKIFNDTLGHLQGDQVLKLVSNILSTQLRRIDLLARFGGDEFAVIMPGTDRAGAFTVSQRIQTVMSEYKYAGRQLGLSIGLAVYKPGTTPEQFVEQADRALYRSKYNKAARKTQPLIKKLP